MCAVGALRGQVGLAFSGWRRVCDPVRRNAQHDQRRHPALCRPDRRTAVRQGASGKLAVVRAKLLGRRIEAGQGAPDSSHLRWWSKVGLADQQAVGHGDLLDRFGVPCQLRHDMGHVDDGYHAAVTIPGWRSSWLSTVVWPAPKRALSRVTAIRRSMSREDVRRSERRAGISVVRGARTSGHGRVAQGDSFADQVVARLAVELAPSFAGVATRGALPSATVAIRKSGRKGGKQGGGSGRLSAPFRVGMAFAGNPGNARMPVCLRGLCQGGESVSRAVSRCPAPSWHRPP